MNKYIGLLRRGIAITSAIVLIAFPGLSSASLDLANSPLFLGNTVQPNIFFVLDDSGSMDWSIMTPESNGLLNVTCLYLYTHPAPGVVTSEQSRAPTANVYDAEYNTSGWFYVVPTEEYLSANGIGTAPYGGVWRAWNKDYNKVYYDPSIDYTPWKGEDTSGNTYANASPSAAPYNPYKPTAGALDLTTNVSYSAVYCPDSYSSFTVSYYPARYYVWTDTDSDGNVDDTDAHTLVEIKATTPECSSNGNVQPCLQRPYADEIQNFANWFTYYRKRDLVLKRSVTELVFNSSSRMGMITINEVDNLGIEIKDMTITSNKDTLLANVSQVRPNGNTPLRQALRAAGKYYEGISGNTYFGNNSDPNHPASDNTVSSLSPILDTANGGACQQNFTILMTDGFYNGGSPDVGNTDADGDSPDSAGNTTFDGGAYADTNSDTLADVAMHYYERDLQSGLTNDVPVIAGVDDANHQHMVTFTVAFGVNGTLTADPPNTTDAFAWPDTDTNAGRIDDMRHAAFNGRGDFLSAQNSAQLQSSLNAAISAIADRTGSAASVAVNSRALNTQTRIYQARFTSGEWSGDLRALPIDLNGNVGAEVWSAKDQLKAQAAGTGWDTNRVIITHNGTNGIAFRWNTGTLTSSQQTALQTDPATSTVGTAAEGQARLEFLRGRPASEFLPTYTFRERIDNASSTKFVLGDIVDSTPIYVGAPYYLPELETTAHATFRAAHTNRREMIYVGGNDGMLHGFDAATGDEKIAYVPNLVFNNLNQLTDPGYIHRNYVNGSPTVSDAFFGSSWHTVLVSGLGNGGKGIFALDVTDPDGSVTATLAFNESNASNIALWEFNDSTTTTAGDDMGYTYSRPVIARMHNGKWAAIFGNGYNSVNGNSVLYIVDIADGSIIKKISLGSGPDNGASSPAVVDADGDYLADYIYVGDLKGAMWKIDVTASNPNSWEIYHKQGSTRYPLFVATDGTDQQPITQRPEVGPHPDGLGGFMVYFGTGKYIENADRSPQSSPVHTFYGIWDKNDDTSVYNTGLASPLNRAGVLRADLLSQTLSTTTTNGQTVRTVSNNTMVWRPGSTTPDYLGWRVDLDLVTGEMSVTDSVLVGGSIPRIIFTTLIPETASTCSYGGTSWLMELNPQNGGQLSGPVFDIDNDGDFADEIVIAGVNPGIGIMPAPVIIRDTQSGRIIKGISGSTGAVTTNIQAAGTSDSGRQSWRQLR